MISLLVTWIALTVGMFVASKLLDGFQIKGGVGSHLVVSAVFGVLGALIGWALSFVIVVGTLGLATLVPFLVRLLVMTILLLVTNRLTSRLSVKNFRTAFVAALIVAVVGAVTEQVLARAL
jgi:putative membrane protein